MSNSLVESSLLTIMEKEQEVMVETSEVENTEAAPAVEEVAPKRVSNASVPVDQFDWDSFEESTSEADRKADEEMYNQTLSKIVENEVVEGTVMAIGKREVLVNIGYKSEGVINISEFRYNPDLKVGDKVEVYVETAEDKKGQLILSHRKAHSLRSWDLVNEAYEKDEIVKGYVKCRTKGGMIVDVFGIEAFLPGSQIDVKPIRDYDVYVNKTMDFKIVKINNEYRNVVVSHKALIEAEIEAQKAEIISKLEKGQILEGTVKNITSYGVFGTSPPTVCSWTSAVWTDSSTSQTSPGAVSTIPRKSCSLTRRSTWLSSTSMIPRNVSLSVSSSSSLIPGMLSILTSRWETRLRAKWSLSPTTEHSWRYSPASRA